MLSLPPAVRIFVATRPTNMHLSFDRLAALARDVLQQDPLSGHLFVFQNRLGDRVKILFWDRSGFCLWYKRLETGAFHFPRTHPTHMEVEASDLTLLLDGIDLARATRRPRFTPGQAGPVAPAGGGAMAHGRRGGAPIALSRSGAA
jgi:transposase